MEEKEIHNQSHKQRKVDKQYKHKHESIRRNAQNKK